MEFQLTWKKGVPLLSYRRCYLSSRRKNNNSTHIKEIKPLVLAAGSYFRDVEVFMLIAALKKFFVITQIMFGSAERLPNVGS